MFLSKAVTLTVISVPAVVESGALTEKWVAGPATTAIVSDMPVIEGVIVSVAVTVWEPIVFNVTEKVPDPFVRVMSAGRFASTSLLVKRTVPV